ncbi:MAG: hypothetical protein GY859_16065, partial [Desulfobacterales bacterium]|nr:hypothetical protein [Desulfobacterales bacterium]
GGIDTRALCRDVLRLVCDDPASTLGEREITFGPGRPSRDFLLSVQLGCWFFSHPWFRGKPEFIDGIIRFFCEALPEISPHVKPEPWVEDMERREEFCRLALTVCDLTPYGESEKRAGQRFASVSTLKRKKVLSKTAAAYSRMKKIRKKMADKAAREAANVYGRE